MFPEEVVDGKEAQRRAVLAWRAGLDRRTQEEAAQKLMSRALAELAFPPSTVIAGYWPIRSEIDPRPLMFALQKKGYRLALPVIETGEILFRTWAFNDSLAEGAFSTSEPASTAPEVKPDVLFVPLVAFDGARNRLGYGKGYYDKALSRLRRNHVVRVIGLAYEGQKLDALVVEDHDEPLDMVITEQGVYR